MFFFKQIRS